MENTCSKTVEVIKKLTYRLYGEKGKKMENTRNFSWILTVRNEDGTIQSYNVSDRQKGYKQGWYKTPKSAMKALQFALDCEKKYHADREIIEAYCFTRSGKRF